MIINIFLLISIIIFCIEEFRTTQKINELEKKLSEKSKKLWLKTAYTETQWAYKMIKLAKRGYTVTAVNVKTNVIPMILHDGYTKNNNLHFESLVEEKTATITGGNKGIIIIDLESDSILTRQLKKHNH